MPHIEVIKRFAGVIDFYMCRGIACFRKWPKKFKVTSPRQIATNEKLKEAVSAYNLLTDAERLYWRGQVNKPGVSGRDMFISWYIKNS